MNYKHATIVYVDSNWSNITPNTKPLDQIMQPLYEVILMLKNWSTLTCRIKRSDW